MPLPLTLPDPIAATPTGMNGISGEESLDALRDLYFEPIEDEINNLGERVDELEVGTAHQMTPVSNVFTPPLAVAKRFWGVTVANSTLANPTGTPHDMGEIEVRFIKGDTAHTLTLGADYELADGVALTTFNGATTGQRVHLECMFDADDDKWVVHRIWVR